MQSLEDIPQADTGPTYGYGYYDGCWNLIFTLLLINYCCPPVRRRPRYASGATYPAAVPAQLPAAAAAEMQRDLPVLSGLTERPREHI